MSTIKEMIELVNAGVVKVPKTEGELIAILEQCVLAKPKSPPASTMTIGDAMERMSSIVMTSTENWVFESTVIQRVLRSRESRMAGVGHVAVKDFINGLIENGSLIREGMKIKRTGE